MLLRSLEEALSGDCFANLCEVARGGQTGDATLDCIQVEIGVPGFLTMNCRSSRKFGKGRAAARTQLPLPADSVSYFAQVQEKLVPSLDRIEHVEVCGLLELAILVICTGLANFAIAPLVELSVA